MIASGIIAKSNDNNNTKRVLINAIYLACAIINYVAKNCIGRNGMTGETTTLERPIDAMFLIHKALPGEADRTVEQARNLEDECSLQGFKLAFTAWANAVVYHAEKEVGTEMSKYVGDSRQTAALAASFQRRGDILSLMS